MESLDGAEICELFDLYILSFLVYRFQNVGLYWDDGGACLDKIDGPVFDKIQKDIITT